MPPIRRRTLDAAIIAVTLVAAIVAAWAMSTSSRLADADAAAALAVLLGGSFVGAGLFVWRQDRANRTGPLMIAAGLVTLVSELQWVDASAPFIIGLVLTVVPLVLMGHVLLAFPTGRLGSALPRGIIATGWLITIGWFLWLPFANPAEICAESSNGRAGATCPANPLLIHDPAGIDAAAIGSSAMRVLGILLIPLALTVLVRRWRAGTPAWRHSFAPVMIAGWVLLAAMLATVVAELWVTQTDAPSGEEIGLWFNRLFSLAASALPFAFLVGLARAQQMRVTITRAVGALGRSHVAGGVRDALARELHDPTLDIAYYLPTEERWVNGAGDPVVFPCPRGRCTTIVSDSNGSPIAALMHDEALGSDPALVHAAGSAAALALENERLHAKLRARLDELRQSRARIVEAGDEARRQIERNLHDGTQARLSSVAMALGLAESRFDADPEEARRIVGEARAGLAEALRELRELSQGVHPGVLTERGLAVALKELTYRSPVPIDLRVGVAERLPEPVEAGAYYVVAEALANASKHADASRIEVDVARENGTLSVRVVDDGIGGAALSNGSGLRGLIDRVSALGGEMRVASPVGEGTAVEVELPCGS